jgi:hypothetical protein
VESLEQPRAGLCRWAALPGSPARSACCRRQSSTLSAQPPFVVRRAQKKTRAGSRARSARMIISGRS